MYLGRVSTAAVPDLSMHLSCTGLLFPNASSNRAADLPGSELAQEVVLPDTVKHIIPHLEGREIQAGR